MRNSSLSQKAGMCSEGCPARARALSLPGPRPPGSSCPGDRGSPESEGITRLLLRSAPAPSEPGSRSAAGKPHPAPTCSTKALGQIVKPRSAAGPRDSHTAAASSLGLSRIRGSVREAPRRTSPKQRKGDLQKWLRDRTAGDAASSSARGPLGPARGRPGAAVWRSACTGAWGWGAQSGGGRGLGVRAVSRRRSGPGRLTSAHALTRTSPQPQVTRQDPEAGWPGTPAARSRSDGNPRATAPAPSSSAENPRGPPGRPACPPRTNAFLPRSPGPRDPAG